MNYFLDVEMFRSLEQSLLDYKKTGNYPIQLKEIGYIYFRSSYILMIYIIS